MEMECEPSTSTAAVVYKRRSARIFNKAKRRCGTGHSVLTLDTLPEDVLLELFQYINSSDLNNLCVCSLRIRQICQDHNHRLWRTIRDCCNGVRPHHNPLLSMFTNSTTRIEVSSNRNVTLHQRQNKIGSRCLGPDFFTKLKKLPKLETFILRNHSFDIETFDFSYFPKSLTELRLNGSHAFRKCTWNYVFFNIHKELPNLEILDLSRCYWMKTPVLNGICKCAKIKTLILFGCRRLEITSFMMENGAEPIFSSLETFDVRKTEVELEDVINWPILPNLKHFFIDTSGMCPNYETSVDAFDIERVTRYLLHLETLVIRNDVAVANDILLMKLMTGAQSLKYLDVTNTGCSDETIITFQKKRPDVKLIVSDRQILNSNASR